MEKEEINMDKRKYQCEVCGEYINEEDIYAIYPEDNSIICKRCFGVSTNTDEREE